METNKFADHIPEFVEKLTSDLEYLTDEIVGAKSYIEKLCFLLINVDAKNNKALKLIKVELRTNRCMLKVLQDKKALFILLLNVDPISHKKRLKQFKRHSRQYLDCFLNLDDFEIDEDDECSQDFFSSVIFSCSFAIRMKKEGSEEFYRNFCIAERHDYNMYCQEKHYELMANEDWRRCRGKC
mgnify:CR=1 FL=1|jgi:hypothetical protein|tara:strand:- start:30 stop:578 length:549 start_codon:yes stop_codon:yes gene_type:complete